MTDRLWTLSVVAVALVVVDLFAVGWVLHQGGSRFGLSVIGAGVGAALVLLVYVFRHRLEDEE